jgi:hypothetical protein
VQVGQVAVVVVRRDVDLARLGQPPDLHGLREAVPRYVDDRDVDRVPLEERTVLAQRHQALARGQAGRGRLLDLQERVRVPVVVLDPLHVILLEQLGDPQHALGPEVVVEVQAEADLRPHRLAKGPDQAVDRLEDLDRWRAVGRVDAAREAWEVHGRRVAGNDHVRLERREAPRHDFAPQRGNVVVGLEGRRAEKAPHARPGGSAVRPVEPHAVAQRSAEELVDRHAERLGLDVPQGQLDAGHGLVRDAAAVLPDAAQHVPVEPLDGARILTDQEIRQVLDAARDAVRAPVVAALAPAHQAAVGLDAHERPRPPARVAMERFDSRDLHGLKPPSGRQRGRFRGRSARARRRPCRAAVAG